MSFTRAGQLARWTPSALPDDTLGLVAENLRESPCGALPIFDRLAFDDPTLGPEFTSPTPRVLGVVDERDLSRATLPLLERLEEERRASITGEAPLPEVLAGGERAMEQITAREIMRPNLGVVPAQFSLHNALLTLDRYDASALPVIDEVGRYRGMISRADIVAALGKRVRPPVVGGMATPLGVWLTTGSISAGAPKLGLFLSGVTLGLCLVASDALLQVLLSAFNEDLGQSFASGRLGAASGRGDLWNFFVTGAQSLLFLLLLRATPMSGIHAAEHQTVWAIEKGVSLTPESVAKMPRAHPRCGTNLMALAGLIMIVFGHLPSFDKGTVLLALVFIFLFWRNLGSAMQVFLTTRPASRKQLESGIRAGNELLEKYQSQPHVPTSFALRLFNSGLLLSAAGFMLVSYLYEWGRSLLASQAS
jgi:CBS domain-containing protein